MKNNKYDIFTILTVVITLTILAIAGIILVGFIKPIGEDIGDFAQEMVDDGQLNQINAYYATDFIVNDVDNYTDNYIFWFFVATFIGLILTGLYLDFEPAIMIVIFLFGGVAVLSSWIGSEMFSEFATDTEIVGMTKTNLLMGNPYFSVFIFIGLVIMLIIMYSKKRSSEYQWKSY